MVSYICYRCNYTTNRKSDIRTHLNRKTLCVDCGYNIKLTNSIKIYILQGLSYIKYKQIIDNNKKPQPILTIQNNEITNNNNIKNLLTIQNNDITIQNNNIINNNISKNMCNYCNNSFSFKTSLIRHLKSCKVKNSEVELLKNEMELLKTELDKLKLENNKVNDKLNEYEEENEELKYIINQKNKIIKENKSINKYTNCNNNTTNTNCNNITNNIVVNNYTTPNIEYLEYNIKKECVYTDYVYFLPILKALFFNKEHPENHSISYSNTRSNKMSVFNGNEWILQNRMDTINDIIDNCDDILSEFINDIRNSDKITYKQGKMINLYEKFISNYTLNNNDYKSLHEYIYMESKNLNIKPPIKTNIN